MIIKLHFLLVLFNLSCVDLRYKEIEKKSESTSIDSNKVVCGLEEGKLYSIKKEVDGDTFWIDDGCDGVKIRLIGIDAPESKNVFSKVKKEPFGLEACAYMSSLLKNQRVRIEFDIDTFDQYGRTLVYAFSENDIFLNKAIVDEGLAVVMTIPPNVRYSSILFQSQVEARKMRKNIWFGVE